METRDLQELIDKGTEFYDMETGRHYRPIGTTKKCGKPVIMIEPIEGE